MSMKMQEVDKWETALKPVLSDFSQDFWKAVQSKFNESQKSAIPLSWRRCMDEVRVDMLKEKNLDGKDPLFFLLTHAPQHYQQQVDRLAAVFFQRDKDLYYAEFDDESSWKTLLHVAAERNLVFVAKQLMKYYPDSNLLFITCPYNMKNGKQADCTPLLLALERNHDGVASFLIKEIIVRSHPERVRAIFQPKDDKSEPLWKFADLIKDGRMQDTVVEVLNCLLKPEWPYLPELEESNKSFEEERNKAWTCVTDDPTKYHFYYQIIDGDQSGRPLRTFKDSFWSLSLASYEDKEKYPSAPKSIEGKCNPHCSLWEKSCLQLLAESNNKRAIQHPVVRKLVRRKWSLYGKKYVSFYAGLYLGFLLCLSFALWQAATVSDPLVYSDDAAELVRMICEGLVILILIFYVIEEIYQLLRERRAYWSDKYNYFDIFGLLFVFAVVPLRILDISEQWIVASIAYALNVFRIFKFACLFESTAVYTNTLAIAISKVIPRFLAVFVVVLLALCGSYFFALRWENQAKGIGNFLDVAVIGLRTLTEQEGFYDTHSKWFSLVVGQLFMFAIIVVMVNLLIAQLSDAYANACRRAHVQTDIDRILVITRLEHSWIHKFNRRMRHYMPGDWSYDVNHVKELIKDWQDEGQDEKIDYIRDFLRETEKRSTVGNLSTPKLREIMKDLLAKIGQHGKHTAL